MQPTRAAITAVGQSRSSRGSPVTSGVPQRTDILGSRRHVSKVSFYPRAGKRDQGLSISNSVKLLFGASSSLYDIGDGVIRVRRCLRIYMAWL